MPVTIEKTIREMFLADKAATIKAIGEILIDTQDITLHAVGIILIAHEEKKK